LVKVVDAQVYGSENDLGHFTGGFIQLEGRIRQMFTSFVPWEPLDRPQIYLDIGPIGEAVPYCMPVVVTKAPNGSTVIRCLILKPVDQQNSTFTRMGLLAVHFGHPEHIHDKLQWIADYELGNQPVGDLTVITIL
jgi:hypothetical protein